MVIFFNIYGTNLNKLSLSDINFDYISFTHNCKNYVIDMAGYIKATIGDSIEGKYVGDTKDFNNTDVSELETALKNANYIDFAVSIDGDDSLSNEEYEKKYSDVVFQSYDIEVMIGDTDRCAHGNFKYSEDNLRVIVANFISSKLKCIVSDDYVTEIFHAIINEVTEDVIETSGFHEDGSFNEDDIKLAVGRVIANKI